VERASGVIPEKKSLGEDLTWNFRQEAKSGQTSRGAPEAGHQPGSGEVSPSTRTGARTQHWKSKGSCCMVRPQQTGENCWWVHRRLNK